MRSSVFAIPLLAVGIGEPELPVTTPSLLVAILSLTVLMFSARSAQAALFSLTVTGTVSENSSGDPTIPVDTPWMFELVYDTAAPDLDSEDPTSGIYDNTDTPPAFESFHFQAGDYEATIDDPTDFGELSDILVTFTPGVNALDINILAPDFLPPLAGGAVTFHADFNNFSTAIFDSDALPSNPALDLGSFDESTVTLSPPTGVVSSSSLTSLAFAPVPEPSSSALAIAGLVATSWCWARGSRSRERPPAATSTSPATWTC